MKRDDITKLAREAGFEIGVITDAIYASASCRSELERFAALVAAAEREECAKVCELIDTSAFGTERPAPNDCAAAIRARSQA